MNNTNTLAIVAVFIAATLVVGLTVTAAATPSAFAGGKKDGQDKYMKGGQNDDYKKGTQDNGNDGGSGNGNGNTVTILKADNKGFASGFDTNVNQEAQNTICTHPASGASCISEGNEAPVNATDLTGDSHSGGGGAP